MSMYKGVIKSSKKQLTLDDISTGLLVEAASPNDWKFNDWVKSKGWKPLHKRKPTGELSLLEQYSMLPRVENQLNVGSCVSCAVTSLLEFGIRNHGVFSIYQESVSLSVLYQYWYARYTDLKFDSSRVRDRDGSTHRGNLEAISKFGWLAEPKWPYVPLLENQAPGGHLQVEAQRNQGKIGYFKLDNVDDMVHCLEEGWPFVVGFPTFKEEVNASLLSGVIEYPNDYKKNYSGHSVFCWGLDHVNNPRYNLIRNSWGRYWGRGGDGKLDFRYMEPPAGQKTEVWKPWTIRPI